MNEPTARLATPEDLGDLVALYRGLDEEMCDLRPSWRRTNGLPPPFEEALGSKLRESTVIIGVFDDVPVGFLIATPSDTAWVVEYVFTQPEARGISVGEAMMHLLYERAARYGVDAFDVAVLPGHRATKNFFEGQGFKARLIIMHHDPA